MENIEVKGTGSQDFQSFYERALQSPFTYWVDYYGMRENSRNCNYNVYKMPIDNIINFGKEVRTNNQSRYYVNLHKNILEHCQYITPLRFD